MEDLPSLPYIRSTMKEVLRWLPTATLGAVVISFEFLEHEQY
jgi:hypothetical protein